MKIEKVKKGNLNFIQFEGTIEEVMNEFCSKEQLELMAIMYDTMGITYNEEGVIFGENVSYTDDFVEFDRKGDCIVLKMTFNELIANQFENSYVFQFILYKDRACVNQSEYIGNMSVNMNRLYESLPELVQREGFAQKLYEYYDKALVLIGK